MQRLIDALANPWVVFGFAAQFLFFMRFFLQWVASERRGKSYIPVVFWWFSLGGGSMLFVYAIQRGDPVFIAGQGLGCLIYVRNLVLIHRRQARRKARKRSAIELLMSDGMTANSAEAYSADEGDARHVPVGDAGDPIRAVPTHRGARSVSRATS